MSTLNYVRELHSEPGSQHATIRTSESNHRGVLILSVVLDHHDKLLVVHESLIESEVLDMIFCERFVTERQRLSVISVFTQQNNSVELLG